MGWFAPRSPVSEIEQAWIEDSFAWLVAEFGEDAVRRPIAEPTREHFPIGDLTGEPGVHRTMYLVGTRMGVHLPQVELEYIAGRPEGRRRWQHAYRGPAGHYHEVDGTSVITVYGDQTPDPTTLVATLAHELGHVRLLGEGRIADDRRDGEPLTDLLTVVLGLGIFTANAAFDFTADDRGWQSQRLGYMTEQMYGYALARYTLHRGEPDPRWARHLDTNPRAYMRQALRYLHRAA
jgi:hypothetical protein